MGDLDQAKGERAPAIRETGREHSKHHIASKPSAAQTPKGRDRGCTRAHTKETTQETYLKIKMKASLLTKTRFSGARLAIKAASRRSASVRMGARAEVGLFYSTSTGNTEAAADWIKQKFGGEITDPTDLEGYSSLIVGAPTWNTGADEGRSGTAWDEVIEEIKDLDLSGKKVAVFGCGDSSSYGDYFCDAIEEVYSAMKDAGATMVGFVDPSGYDFAESKSVIDGKFCGLPLDEDNESDMTEDRVAAWCAQISGEGLA